MQMCIRAAACVIFFTVCAGAQTVNEELATLRQNLGVSSEMPIHTSQAPLPGGSPLKAYIAVGLELDVQRNFQNWTDEWNRKYGKKHGQVELVSSIAQADVILARYIDRSKTTSQIETSTRAARAWDPATGEIVGRPVAVTNSYSVAPVVCYILLQKTDGLEIVYRYADVARVSESKHAGELLRDNFFSMVMARSQVPRK
jgi:hypothetical protein